ncbi:MAG: hypothetical protein A3I11_04265 [Elusimicrobia bacterium RIFCSPLOWO2_02_FULL_39_32]|nr:MAG: hypothetical protein A3B80_02835 [Elusimicrobia bacterium RIFCSPHIGHO2_02_FULL_39_36]OGR92913.1 MAG: hypothetical protein A3I11_04265 [Elusimicrobia bacterium RIFCSPLOWO2_02_FULL_39_32]
MKYKVIYKRKECIGANSCVGVLPEFWSLDHEKKAVLKGSILNPETGCYELIVNSDELERFKESALVCPVYVINIIDLQTQKTILEIFEENREIEKESAPVIKARPNTEKESQSEPKGFFTIQSDSNKKLIKALYYGPKHQLLFVIEGKNAEELYQTIIREGFVTSLTQAAYLGGELKRAEMSFQENSV